MLLNLTVYKELCKKAILDKFTYPLSYFAELPLKFLFLFFIFFAISAKAQPPSCTHTISSGSATYVVNSGETYCFPDGTSYNGTVTVNPGGNIVICETEFYGSVAIFGYLWQTTGVNVYGSYFYAGQGTSTSASNCCTTIDAGSIGNGGTICAGSTRGLTSTTAASGGDGTNYSYQWETRYDNGGGFSAWGNAGGTSTNATYTTAALAAGTHEFRRKVTSGSCGNATTATVTVTVDAATVGGSITTAASVCSGSNGATLTLAGHTGSITKWQYSTDNWTTPVDITNTGTTQAYLNLTSTTKYRAVVQSGVCSAANSSDVTITVSPATVGGSITTAASVCYGSNGATLTLAGHTGSVSKWQYSTDNWTTPVDIVNTGTTQAYTNLTTTTKYRAVVQSGACSATNSSDVTITVYADLSAGAIGSDQTITYNSTPAAFTSTTAASGGGTTTYQWQRSYDNSTWSDVAGATSATYSVGAAVTVDTWYRRAVISSSGCGTLYTTAVKLTVVVSICSGATPPALSEQTAPSGGTGAYTYQWQSSTDNSSFSDIGGATSSTYTPGSVSQSTWYRRCVTSGACTECTQAVKATVSSSPGSISSGLVVWLKADAGTSSIGTQWEDQSGNANHYTTVNGPTLETGDTSSNFMPYVKILSGGFDAPAGAALGSSYTIFMVANQLDSDKDGRIFDGHTGNHYWGYYGTSSTSTTRKLQTFTNSSGSANGVRVDINAGAYSSAESSDARVYELIIYNSVLTTTEIDKIESYLSAKYGLTDNSSYLSSAGTTTYNVATYNTDIIGIGKECYFHQKQSKSKDDSVRVFISTLAATNAANAGTVTNDVSYLMLGHNGGKLKGTAAANADVPPAGTDGYTVSSRIEREWKVKNTNFSNTYSIEIELKDQSTVTSLNDLALLVDVDADGDFTDSDTRVYGIGDQGINFKFGSIIIEGVGPGVIPVGAEVVIALGSVDPATALPVELIEFNAKKEHDYNLITWVTQTEINNSHFIVEKSVDGVNWETVKIVKGAVNSIEKKSYNVKDYEMCSSKCYYRLQQVDLDGTYNYSSVEFIDNSSSNNTELNVYPIPIKDKANIEFTAVESGSYDLQVFNVAGQVVFEAKVICAEGKNLFEINTSEYSNGLYYLVMKNYKGEIVNRIRLLK